MSEKWPGLDPWICLGLNEAMHGHGGVYMVSFMINIMRFCLYTSEYLDAETSFKLDLCTESCVWPHNHCVECMWTGSTVRACVRACRDIGVPSRISLTRTLVINIPLAGNSQLHLNS